MTSQTAKMKDSYTGLFTRKCSCGDPRVPGLPFTAKVVADAVNDPAYFVGREQFRSNLIDVVAACRGNLYANHEKNSKQPRSMQSLEILKRLVFEPDLDWFNSVRPTTLGKTPDEPYPGKSSTDTMKFLEQPISSNALTVLLTGGLRRDVSRKALETWWDTALPASTDDNAHPVTHDEYFTYRPNSPTSDPDDNRWLSYYNSFWDSQFGHAKTEPLDLEIRRTGFLSGSTGGFLNPPTALMSTFSTLGIARFPGHVLEGAVPVLSEMRAGGLGVVCDRLDYLYQLQADDPDDPPILLHCLQLLKQFLLANPRFATDRLGVDSTGCLTATWILRREGVKELATEVSSYDSHYWGNGDGILVMVFQPTGLVRFAANSGPPMNGVERLRCNGILPADSVLSAVPQFTRWLMSA